MPKSEDRVAISWDEPFVTNVKFSEKRIEEKSAKFVLIKVKPKLAALTETLINAVNLAHQSMIHCCNVSQICETEEFNDLLHFGVA